MLEQCEGIVGTFSTPRLGNEKDQDGQSTILVLEVCARLRLHGGKEASTTKVVEAFARLEFQMTKLPLQQPDVNLSPASQAPPRFQVYTQRNLDQIQQLQCLSEELRFDIRVVAQVLPFRVNQYVIDELIAWEDVPNDPIFRLVFPQREMLDPADISQIANL